MIGWFRRAARNEQRWHSDAGSAAAHHAVTLTVRLRTAEDVLRRHGQQVTGDGLAVDIERALLSARAAPASEQSDQLGRLHDELRAVDDVLAATGADPSEDRLGVLNMLLTQRDRGVAIARHVPAVVEERDLARAELKLLQ